MVEVSFKVWMEALRRAAKRRDIRLEERDEVHLKYYNRNDTPYGALMDIEDFCYQ